MSAAMPQTPLSGGPLNHRSGLEIALPNIHDDEALIEIVRQLSK